MFVGNEMPNHVRMPTPDSTFLEGTQGSHLEGDVTQQDPFLTMATEHANGETMPSAELHLQSILNSEITPSYSLREVPGLDNWAAQSIIFFEIKTNFPNALAHVREARELFPEDQVLQQADFQVLKSLRQNPPTRPMEAEKDTRSFFGRFFSSIKKDTPEKKDVSKKKDSVPEDAVEEEPSADPMKTPKGDKKKEKFSILSVFSIPSKKKDDPEDSKRRKSKEKDKSSSKGDKDEEGLVDAGEEGPTTHEPTDQALGAPAEVHDGPYDLPLYDLPPPEGP
eukprot:GGOE01022972.1.p1 GENE.GGOE01022972.1~~GGOE01022972.1.p1  ORF type:complete len:280 (-),score=84.51 GGOE01022972.1:538-1377(-)